MVNAVLLQPLAYPDAERLVSVETLWTNTGRASQDVSGPDFLDWQAQNDVFEKMAVSYGGTTMTIRHHRRRPRRVCQRPYVSAEFFAVFGQTASAGRLLTEHDVPAARRSQRSPSCAYHWAVAHFGSAEAAVGKTITVYGNPLEIVGVAAPGFRYPGAADLWAPGPRPAEGRTAACTTTGPSGSSRQAWISRVRRRRCGPSATRSRGNIPRIA